MELRHIRYFVAVAEEGSFLRAARRLRVAQPALSKQVRDLESELTVSLFERLPRGVRLTPAGEAFLPEARGALDSVSRAVARARRAGEQGADLLHFAHGEMAVYGGLVAELLAAFRKAHPAVEVRVSHLNEVEQRAALRQHDVDVAATFLTSWPVAGLGEHHIADCSATGVLLPTGHALAAQPRVRLGDLRDLTFLHFGGNWPEVYRAVSAALRDRGLVPSRQRERSPGSSSAQVDIAAGDGWSLANEAIAAQYLATAKAIVYRPFVEPPIPGRLALVWPLDAPSGLVPKLVDVARCIGAAVGPAPAAARPA